MASGCSRALFNLTPGRREVKRLTGNYWVPVLVTDDGEVIQGSRRSRRGRRPTRRAAAEPAATMAVSEVRRTTVAELEDWEQGGATWRPVELGERRAVVELCSCSGEPMERVESGDPELIEFVRAHPRPIERPRQRLDELGRTRGAVVGVRPRRPARALAPPATAPRAPGAPPPQRQRRQQPPR